MKYLLLLLLFISCNEIQEIDETNPIPTYKVEINKDELVLDFLYVHIPKWEGKVITNYPEDKGGLTNSGLTYTTWKHIHKKIGLNSFEKLDDTDIQKAINYYYYTFNCNKVNDLQLSALFTETYWGGNILVREYINHINYTRGLNLKLNSKISGYSLSEEVLKFLNNENPAMLYNELLSVKYNYLYRKVEADSSQRRFLKGWLNRTDDFKKNCK
jgi:hypothetical protein